MPWTAPRIPTDPAERLVLILLGLREVLAVRSAKEHALGPLVILIAKRMARLTARFTKLLAAFREGRLRPPRPRPPRQERRADETPESTAEAGSPPPSRPQKPRVPRRVGWMIRVTQGAAVFGSQLQFWLEDAEVQALIAAAPKQAGRLLRPICHALLVPLPPALRLPRRPRRKRPKPDNGPFSGASGPGAVPRGRPTKAEIKSWMPGQKRPMPFGPGCAARAAPPPLFRPKPKFA